MTDHRPRVVLVTGAPGSGKTSLGLELSRELRLPFFSRDDVRGGLFFTSGAWTDQPAGVPSADEAVEALLRLVESAAGLGVSSIVEYVVRDERPSDLGRIVAVADCVVLRTVCRDALDRFTSRNVADRLLNRHSVLAALGHTNIDEHTVAATARMRSVAAEMRTDFDLPVLRVDTDDGFTPDIEAIIEFVTQTPTTG